MSVSGQAIARYKHLVKVNSERDARMRSVLMVRTGKAQFVFQGLFPDDWPAPVVANAIDIAAQDTAESVGVLPTLSAYGDSVLIDSNRNRADKLTRIVNAYCWESSLGTSLVSGADYLVTFGQAILRVEPHYEAGRPHIHVDSPLGSYVERDRFNRITGYFRSWRKRASELAALYPEHSNRLWGKNPYNSTNVDRELTLLKSYEDDGSVQLLVLEEPGLVLDAYMHPLGRVPIAVAQRPTIDGQVRGQYDDAIWVWAARARLALLSLEATEKAVEAPIAVPADVQEFALGPDALIRSATPQNIRRVGLDLPQSALIADRSLESEVRTAARFPQVREGNLDASVVTGRGVQALMGGFDSRIKSLQSLLGEAVSTSLSMALEMDERAWPDEPRQLTGSANGSPYTIKYTPSRDIRGDYGVSYEYGLLAGLDPNRALVWGLQALGAGLLSKTFLRRNLPISLDVAEEEQVMDVENLRESLMTSIQAYAQAIPEMAATGQDASDPVRKIAGLIAARKKGTPVEKAAEVLFPEPAPPPEVSPASMDAQPGPPGQMPMQAPGGGPSFDGPPPAGMQQMLAQLSGTGNPSTSVRTMMQQPIA
jgi:hypothetical protein